ncbi:MAG: hypothetical protein ACOC92_01020 [bacterium]
MAPSEDDTTHRPGQDPPEPQEDSPRADEPTSPESQDPTTTAASEAPQLVERFFWIDPEMDACLREAAGDEKTESEVVRELLRSHYRLD